MRKVKNLYILVFIVLIIISISMVYVVKLSTDSKELININEIGAKIKVNNQHILIPSNYDVKNVYLNDDGFTSPWVEVLLSNDINVYIYQAIELKNTNNEFVGTKKLGDINIQEYKAKNDNIEYIFKVDKLIYLYRFSKYQKNDIDEYLINNL